MQQDDVEIFTQARNELLKSLLSQSDFDHEREQYLLAESNLLHKGIEIGDDILTPFLGMVLKSLTIEDFHAMEADQPIRDISVNTKKRRPSPDKTATRRLSMEEADHRLSDRFSHGSDFNVMHSKWPELKPLVARTPIERIENQSKTDIHPWSKSVHPLLMKHPGTGNPTFVEVLKEYYLPDDDGKSPARSFAEIERNHENHYKKNPVIEGVGKDRDKRHLFIGPLNDDQKSVSGATHEHDLYERAYERWKQENMSTVDSILRDGGTERDLREAHFDDAAKLWTGENNLFETTDRDKSSLESVFYTSQMMESYENYVAAGNSAEDAASMVVDEYGLGDEAKSQVMNVRHPHKLGWLGYHMGLEWLDPVERSEVIAHLNEHSSGDPDNYHVKLMDGHKVPISRFKRNMMMRAGPELNWMIGHTHRSIPNTHRHVETRDDKSYETSLIQNALGSVIHPEHETLNLKFLSEINKRLGLEQGGDQPLSRVPLYGPTNRKRIRSLMAQSPSKDERESLLYALRTLENELGTSSRDEDLTRSDFYEFIDSGNKHPISELLRAEEDNPYFEEDELQELEDVIKDAQYISPFEADIGNALTPFNSTIGPHPRKLSDSERKHYTESNGVLLGGQAHWSKPYLRGNLGLSDSTHRDGLFSLLGEPGDEKNSMVGRKEPAGLIMNGKLTGLLSSIFRHHKGNKQTHAYTASQVMTPFDRTAMGYTGQKGNHAQHSLSPGLTRRLEHEMDEEQLGSIKGVVNRHNSINQNNGLISDWGLRSGGYKRQITDTLVASNAAHHFRDMKSKGGFHQVGSRDDTGRVTLGPSKRMYSFDEVVGGTAPLHPEVDAMDELIELAYTGNMDANPAKGESELFLQDMDQMEEMILDIEQSIVGEYSKPNPDRSLLQSLEMRKNQIRDRLKQFKNASLQLRIKKIKDDSSVYNFNTETKTSQPDLRRASDMLAIEKIAKDIIMPGYIEKDPDAFNPEVVGVSQFLINTSAALHDAEIMSLHMPHDSHGVKTMADGLLEQSNLIGAKNKGAFLPLLVHLLMDDNSIDIGPEMTPEELLAELGLPEDRLHIDMAQKAIDSGGTKVSTISTFLNSNFDKSAMKDASTWLKDNFQDSYRGVGESHDDIVAHMLSETEGHIKHPLHDELNVIRMLLRADNDGTLESMGIAHHGMKTSDLGLGGTKGSGRAPLKEPKKRELSKRALSELVTFDSNAFPPEQMRDVLTQEEVNTGTSVKRMETPIDSAFSVNGATPHLYFSSSGLQYHHGSMTGTPTVRAFADSDGNPQFGTETERMSLLPVSEETLLSLHGQQTFDTAQQMAQTAGGVDFETTSTPFDISNRSLTQPDPLFVAKALPSEMPLIEPYHKVFEYEDIEELRGFTGDWAVSVMEDGTRVKITKKGTYVSVKDDDNESVSISSETSKCLRKLGKRNYVVDAVKNSDGIHIFDIMEYDGTDVTDMDVRERMKLLRGQFDSHEDVYIPGPSTLRITDEDGLEEAIKFIQSENKDKKILLRDAKSTYMRGEEKHPKWVLMTKSDDDFHVPFGMEIDEDVFILHFDHDILKYDIVDDRVENPRSALSSLKDRDYTLVLAKSLESYWMPAFDEMLKAYANKKTTDAGVPVDDSDKSDWDEERANEGMTDERARNIDNQSGGLLKPKKDPNILLKPKMVKAIEIIERALDMLEKAGSGHYPMSGGKGLGIDVGADVASPRGPTTLNNEATLPDYDMKDRPEQDPEKAEDYPRRKKKSEESTSLN